MSLPAPFTAITAAWIASALAIAPATPVAAATCDASCASPAGCNRVAIEIVFWPEVAAATHVSLTSYCGATPIKGCQVSFTPPSSGSPLEQLFAKCRALETAIASDPVCQSLGYSVTADCNNLLLEIADSTCPGATLGFAASCDRGIACPAGPDMPACNHEMEYSQSLCSDAAQTFAEVTIRGVATGIPIELASGGPAHMNLLLSNTTIQSHEAELFLLTPPGTRDRDIVADFERQLRSLFPLLQFETRDDGRTLRVTNPTAWRSAPSMGINTDDTGLNAGVAVGPRAALPPQCPLPPRSAPSSRGVSTRR